MTIAKFEIETTFSTGKEGYDPERESYERKVEIVRKQAHDNGFKEGHAQALQEIEAKTQETLTLVHTALGQLFETRLEVERGLEVQSVQLAHLTAKKLVTSLVKKYPTEEIENLINECLMSGYKEPKIVIRSSEELLQSLTAKIEEMVQTTGFQGELAIIPDANLSSLDCTVEWPNGGANRNLAILEKQIQDKIEAYIQGPLDQTAVQSIEENLAIEENLTVEENLAVEENVEAQENLEAQENETTTMSDETLDQPVDNNIEIDKDNLENKEDNQE